MKAKDHLSALADALPRDDVYTVLSVDNGSAALEAGVRGDDQRRVRVHVEEGAFRAPGNIGAVDEPAMAAGKILAALDVEAATAATCGGT